MHGDRAVLTRDGQRLADWTTLRLGGPARSFVEVSTRGELYDVVAAADEAGEPVLVLGGGSNLVVGDEGFPGTVVRVATRGVAVDDAGCGVVEVAVEAGEDWDELVALVVRRELVGMEALAGIPGTVGAVPIQNVGAYGQEVADTIASVQVFDRQERRTRTFAVADCGFGYRTSLFKRSPGRYVVGAVTFSLRSGSLGAPVEYAELARALHVELRERAASADVREAVLHLRRRKGMVLQADDLDTWSAGSFFTNPFIEVGRLPEGAPAFPAADGRYKTSAAWLIEHAGFSRGYGNARVALSGKHTLALTNRGSATTADLLALASEIRAGVRDRFAIDLEPEPTFVNCSLPPR